VVSFLCYIDRLLKQAGHWPIVAYTARIDCLLRTRWPRPADSYARRSRDGLSCVQFFYSSSARWLQYISSLSLSLWCSESVVVLVVVVDCRILTVHSVVCAAHCAPPRLSPVDDRLLVGSAVCVSTKLLITCHTSCNHWHSNLVSRVQTPTALQWMSFIGNWFRRFISA